MLLVALAAMMGGTTTPGLAQTQEDCPEGTILFVIIDPATVEPVPVEGCGNYATGPESCLSGFEFIPEYGICFAPFDNAPTAHPLTKEACKEDFAARGFENQGQCISAVS